MFKAAAGLLFLCAASFIARGAAAADVCEMVLTQAEIAAAGRARAVEFFGPAKSSTWFARVVNAAGDVNGDGFDDFVIAAPYEGSNAGAVYLIFGRSAAAWAISTFNFSAETAEDPQSWIKISADTEEAILGFDGFAFGDFNGDGLSDLLISSRVGKVFCVFGRSGAWNFFNTSEIESGAVPGFAITGGLSESRFVGSAGDMNGDGIEDLFVSDFDHDEILPSTVFVVFGKAGATRDNFNLSTADGTNGFSIADGSIAFGFGKATGSAGDVNGDGLADLVVGSRSDPSFAGRAFIVFARNVSATGQHWPSWFNLTSELDGKNGFIVDGPSASSSFQFCFTTVGAGDVNADGFADVFIGSSVSAGAWLVFGHPAPWTSPLSVLDLDGSNGFHFSSDATADWWGASGGAAGDVNGDGIDDIVIGGYKANSSLGATTGAAAIIFGRSGTWPAELDRNDAVGSVGFNIDGPSVVSNFGYSARGAGDVNGDGLADFVVGAYEHNFYEGYALLVFGVADHCAVCSAAAEACISCDDGFFVSGTNCAACAEHCRICNASDTCSACDDGFILNSTFCEAKPLLVSSSSSAQQGASVVVIKFNETINNTTELQEEIASVLGIDAGLVSVVVISPTEVEVTIIGSEETAQHLVEIINNGGTGSDDSGLGLLRKAIDAHIRKDTDDNGSSDDDGVDAAPRIALFHPTALVLLTFIIAINNAAAATL